MILTSPTYEGIISDISSIAEICHAKNIPLLVDEAHGAHLGLAENWPDSALHLGADIVVQSVHKTLPSLTQTALLHLGKGSLTDPEEVERQLDVFETSSPSYPLLVSIDGCSQLIAEEGKQLFGAWLQRLERFDASSQKLRHLRVLGHSGENRENIYDFDPSKLPICTAGTDLTGPDLARILRERYGLETEMSQGHICLAMTGMGDSDRAMEHLAKALLEIDGRLSVREGSAVLTMPSPGKQVFTQAEAIRKPAENVTCQEALGRISGEYIWAYPPGIPLTVPGEQITEEFLKVARELELAGTGLHHSHSRQQQKIAVLKEG